VRLIFAGTPEFARVALEQLHAAGHEIALVLSQPDRPGGRGMKLQASPVKQFALDHGLALAQPRSLRLDGKYLEDAAQARAALEAAQAEAMVVAAYGLILPQWVLDVPVLGCLNIHASLLPRWRGAAPIQRALEAGDAQTGISLMRMDAGLDTGDVLLARALPISASDTSASLHDKLAALGAALMVHALEQAANNALKPLPQPTEGITYAHKIEKTEAPINWAQSAAVIAQRIRAFNPFPGASASLNGETLKIWLANVTDEVPTAGTEPGSILSVNADGVVVAALNSVVTLTELQRAGGKRLPVADFLRGFELRPGMVFVASDKKALHA
jgi:methionyl-tRNA formyltransferase